MERVRQPRLPWESLLPLEMDPGDRGRRVTTPTEPTAVPSASSVMTVGPGRKGWTQLPDPGSDEWSRGQRPTGLGPKAIALEPQVLPTICCGGGC